MAGNASARQERALRGAVAKARGKDSARAMHKLCDSSGDVLRIISDPPAIVPVEDLVPGDVHRAVDDWADRILHGYAETLTGDRRRLLARFHYVHAARKIVGVGSVGTRCWIVLLVGRDHDDPLFLQFKEAQPSVLEPYLGASAFAGHGERVVEGQRLMQAAPDILLGWDRMTGVDGVERDFYVRQLWDGKGGADVAAMDDGGLLAYGRLCGWTLARAHARSGDAIAIGAYLGSSDVFDRAMVAFAETYADQNERDYAALQEAVASGRVEAQAGI
jgi:hypothetical protein